MENILKSKKVLLIAGLALLVIAAAFFAVTAQSGGGNSLTQQLSLGEKFLTELNYDKAILAFEKAIKIDPMNVDAYIGLADAYIGKGDAEKATATLQEGYDKTGDSSLKDKLAGLVPKPEAEAMPAFDLFTEGLQVELHDSRTATITIKEIQIHPEYKVDVSTSKENGMEYSWTVRFEDKISGDEFEVGTTYFTFKPGKNRMVSIEMMQHDLWRCKDHHNASSVQQILLNKTDTSLSWSFHIPEEYTFDFANVDTYYVEIRDLVNNTPTTLEAYPKGANFNKDEMS